MRARCSCAAKNQPACKPTNLSYDERSAKCQTRRPWGQRCRDCADAHSFAEYNFSGRAMQPLDAVRKFASDGTLSAMSLPPALLHGSKYASGNLLPSIAGQALSRQCALQEWSAAARAALWHQALRRHDDGRDGEHGLPALLYWKAREKTLLVVVPNAPLGELEAHLGDLASYGSTFEKAWLGSDTEDVRVQRRETFAFSVAAA